MLPRAQAAPASCPTHAGFLPHYEEAVQILKQQMRKLSISAAAPERITVERLHSSDLAKIVKLFGLHCCKVCTAQPADTGPGVHLCTIMEITQLLHQHLFVQLPK